MVPEKLDMYCSSVLAWTIPGTEEPGALQFLGSQKSQSQTQLSYWAHTYTTSRSGYWFQGPGYKEIFPCSCHLCPLPSYRLEVTKDAKKSVLGTNSCCWCLLRPPSHLPVARTSWLPASISLAFYSLSVIPYSKFSDTCLGSTYFFGDISDCFHICTFCSSLRSRYSHGFMVSHEGLHCLCYLLPCSVRQ